MVISTARNARACVLFGLVGSLLVGTTARALHSGADAISTAAPTAASTANPAATSAEASAATVVDQRIGVLASFYPSERDFAGSNHPIWNRLAQAGADVGLVAIGERTAPSIDYKDLVERQQRVGQTVLGTVNRVDQNDFHTRSEAEIAATAAIEKANFGITGVLLTSYSGSCGDAPSAGLIATLHGNGLTVAVRTTATPESCYSPADVLLSFSGTFGAYGSGVARPPWLTGSSPKLWHVIYGVPSASIASVIGSSKAAGADYVFATGDFGPNESTTIPDDGYWRALRVAVRAGAGVAESNELYPAVASPIVPMPIFGTNNPSWAALEASPGAQPSIVIVNAFNGPGTTQVAALRTHIDRAHTAGRRVLGYIPAGYTPTGGFRGSPTARTNAEIFGDASAWKALYNVDGFFIDEVQPECAINGVDIAAIYGGIAAGLRSLLPGAFLALNPGRNIGECFVNLFDAMVIFEGPESSFLTWAPSAWTRRYATTRFWQLVFATNTADLNDVVALAKRRNAGGVFVTTLGAPTQWESDIGVSGLQALREAVGSSAAPFVRSRGAVTVPHTFPAGRPVPEIAVVPVHSASGDPAGDPAAGAPDGSTPNAAPATATTTTIAAFEVRAL